MTAYALPQVTIRGKQWIVDVRLNELREVTDPGSRIDLDNDLTEEEADAIGDVLGSEFLRINGLTPAE